MYCQVFLFIIIYVIKVTKTGMNIWEFIKNYKKISMTAKTEKPYPDILKNYAYGQHKIAELPGVKLHYVESGPKSEELLLFIHGFPDFWYTWKAQIEEFSKEYWVVAVDMRGYGQSSKSRKISFYKINYLVKDVRNLIMKLGRKKFTLIAHDWGGVMAHYFIRMHPDMLNKYILLNTVFHPTLSHISNTKQFLKSWYILWMQIPYFPEFFFIKNDLKKLELLYRDFMTEEEMEAYKYTFGNYENIRGPINYYRANFMNWRKNSIPTAEKLNRSKVPGLYIHGENDMALTLKTSYKKSFKNVNNVKCVTIPNAGHFVHIHSPGVVNRLIKKFLQFEPENLKKFKNQLEISIYMEKNDMQKTKQAGTVQRGYKRRSSYLM